jgi:DNA excision repair protein ERCC-8
MNQLLFDRSSGAIAPKAFARLQTSYLIHAIQPAPRLRFDGGEKEAPVDDQGNAIPQPAWEEKIWAHQAGANALAIDVNNRFLLSGGADSSIRLWDLDENDAPFRHTFKPRATVLRLEVL